MGWTDERVDLMTKLWQDGLSASQVAKQLGGVTRNAVIGKVHRLGLTGGGQRRERIRSQRVPPQPRAPRSPMAPRFNPEPIKLRYVDEGPGVATSLTLGRHMCKWPIGDPSLDSFTFCGRRSEEHGPYCHDHATVAYQPAQAKKKSGAAELARSLRRYI